jgi:membrane protein
MLANAWSLLRQTLSEWSEDGAPRLGAALAYYSVFSIGPILLIAIGVAAIVFESSDVQNQVIAQIGGLIGSQGAETVRGLLANASVGNRSLVSTLIGVGLLLFGAIGVVAQLKDALNIIWDVEEPDAGGLWGYIRKYALSLAGVLGLGFLLTISLVTSTAIGALGQYWAGFPEGLVTILNFAANFGVLTLLFAMMFKWLPDIDLEWRDVWVGAAVTALLFNVGKFLIAVYLGKQGLESTFGAAASIVLILVWVYYSAQIVFFGAEFTQVYARRFGSLAGAAHGQRDTSGAGGQSLDKTQAIQAHVQQNLPYLAYVAIAGTIGLAVGALLARNGAHEDAESGYHPR